MLRVCVVLGLAAAGGLAMTLTAKQGDSVPESLAQDSTAQSPIIIAEPHESAAPAQSPAPVQVAAAGEVASDVAPASPAPAAEPEAVVQADTPMDAGPEQAASAHAGPEMTGAVNVANAAAPEPAQDSALVDLNSASFEQLNTLRDGGPIGRAIIKARPYASVEELVNRKIIRRSTYEKIKDQVTVR